MKFQFCSTDVDGRNCPPSLGSHWTEALPRSNYLKLMPPLCLCSDIRANSTNGHAVYARLCNYIVDVVTLCKTECPHT